MNARSTPVLGLILSLITVLLYSVEVQALKESRLWLPKKHKSAMPRLIAAAELAETNPECLEVLNGQMDRGRSKQSGELVFRIDCRNEHGLSFSLITSAGSDDGLSRLRTGANRVDRDRVKPINMNKGWKICRHAIVESLKKMINPVLLEDPTPRPHVLKSGESIFYVDFDAETLEGYPVYFVSVCKVLPSGKKSVEVKPRRLVVKPKEVDIKRKPKTASTDQKTNREKDKTSDLTRASNSIAKSSKTTKPTITQGVEPKPSNVEKGYKLGKSNKKTNKVPNRKIDQVVDNNSKGNNSEDNDGWEEIIETPPKQKNTKDNNQAKMTTDADGWEVIEETQ